MQRRILGKTEISIAPLVLGGNVFGWTIDEKNSFNILDAFVDNGFNAIDTADVYSLWKSGNKGGESESIIGRWLAKNPSKRQQVVLFTKVGSDLGISGHQGLSAKWIEKAIDDSLKRLQTDYVDLYFSHWPDNNVTHEETLAAYQKLIQAGKVRHIGASNYDIKLLQAAQTTAVQNRLPRYEVLEPEYNLFDQENFPPELAQYCQTENIGVITYYSLASGFLSGKYRSESDLNKSPRGQGIRKYLTPRGLKILSALDLVSERYQVTPADVALAWLMAQPTVTAPIASATNIEQVSHFTKAASLKLAIKDLALLTQASRF